MTTRKTPAEIVTARAVRMANSKTAGRPAPITTRKCPTLLLTVDRTQPGAPAHPEPGTLTLDGTTATLHVGKGWRPGRGQTAALAESLLGLLVVEIVGETGVAGQRTRKYLRAAWRLGDVIASGRYGDDVLATTRRTLELL